MNDNSEQMWQYKGFPSLAAGTSIDDFVATKPSLFDTGFCWPVMVVGRDELDHNVETMSAYCRQRGVDLSPHVKTTMSPEIWGRQLAAGAWALTVATPAQVRVLRAHGVARIFMANELVDAAFARWIADQVAADRAFEYYCYVDSVEGVDLLGAATRHSAERTIRVVVELGHENGRTGCRSTDIAEAAARATTQYPALSLVGVAGYEGGLGRDRSDATVNAVRSYVAGVKRTLEQFDRAGLLDERQGEHIVSCGGSLFFDLVAEELTREWDTTCSVRVVLRSGAYVTHDSLMYEGLSPLKDAPAKEKLLPALRIWCQVLSRPEPGLVLLGAGKRDLSYDEGLPIVLGTRMPAGAQLRPIEGSAITQVNDQHAFMAIPPADQLAVGDLVCLGISHPCTSHDKWRLMPLVDSDNCVVGTVRSYF